MPLLFRRRLSKTHKVEKNLRFYFALILNVSAIFGLYYTLTSCSVCGSSILRYLLLIKLHNRFVDTILLQVSPLDVLLYVLLV